MNKLFITGNLVRDPEKGTTPSGVNYARFTVAVRKRFHREGQPDSDFMRVTAWRGLGDACVKHLAKGRKVGIIGPASFSCYMGNDGQPRGQIEIDADDVEFLSPKNQSPSGADGSGYTQVDNEEAEAAFNGEEYY